MTEDMLRDQAQLFERLGTSAQATRRRAQLQGAHLLSDMESFKAANPRACLGDFVRWYSPRDWVSNTEEGGKLSARMGNPDNIWQELWLVSGNTIFTYYQSNTSNNTESRAYSCVPSKASF